MACASITRGGVGRKTKGEDPRLALACTEANSGRPVGAFLLDLSFVAHNPIQANLSRCWPGQYGELHRSVRGRRNNPPLWKTGAGAWDTPAASSLRGEGADRPWHRQMCRKVGRAVRNRPFRAHANTNESPPHRETDCIVLKKANRFWQPVGRPPRAHKAKMKGNESAQGQNKGRKCRNKKK